MRQIMLLFIATLWLVPLRYSCTDELKIVKQELAFYKKQYDANSTMIKRFNLTINQYEFLINEYEKAMRQ